MTGSYSQTRRDYLNQLGEGVENIRKTLGIFASNEVIIPILREQAARSAETAQSYGHKINPQQGKLAKELTEKVTEEFIAAMYAGKTNEKGYFDPDGMTPAERTAARQQAGKTTVKEKKDASSAQFSSPSIDPDGENVRGRSAQGAASQPSRPQHDDIEKQSSVAARRTLLDGLASYTESRRQGGASDPEIVQEILAQPRIDSQVVLEFLVALKDGRKNDRELIDPDGQQVENRQGQAVGQGSEAITPSPTPQRVGQQVPRQPGQVTETAVSERNREGTMIIPEVTTHENQPERIEIQANIAALKAKVRSERGV